MNRMGLILCCSMPALYSSGQAIKTQNANEIQHYKADKETLAGILLSEPQRQILTTTEREEVSRRVGKSSLSPSEFKDFLLMVIKIRFEIAQDELDRLSRLRKVLTSPTSGISKADRESIDQSFGQCEMPLITKQLLERELYALEAWKPGMSAEKALSVADQRQKKASQ